MEDLYVYQCTKGEINEFRDDVVISPDVHTHSPLTQTSFFLLFLDLPKYFIHIYIILEGE